MSTRGLVALALLATLVSSSPAFAQGESGDDLVAARLVAPGSVVTPGSTVTLGVTFDIAHEWHIYWANPGDAGMPTSVELALPDGWTRGPLLWPAPSRHVQAGPIVSFIYEHRVTLLIELRVPADAPLGKVTVRGRAEWLVCQEGCLTGGGDLSLELEVMKAGTAPAEPSPEAALITQARERLPRPAPADLKATWRELELTLEVPGATGLAFFPLEPAGVNPLDFAASTEARGPRLTLRWPPRLKGAVGGVLEVRRGERTEAVWVSLEGPR